MLAKLPRTGLTRFFRYLNAGMIIFVIAGLGFIGGTYTEVRQSLPDPEHLAAYRPRLTTQIFSTEVYPDGHETHTLLGRVYKEDREPEELRYVPKALRNATVAIEDRPFYHHRGIDPRGIIRAAWVNLRWHGIRQGGSTITQQLAKNMYLSQERTISRKLKEMMLAAELERRFSKDEILEMYLNEVYYGHGAYGIKRAARLYFNKAPKQLTLAECALLAGLPRSPIAYSPYNYPKRALARRHQVLLAMRQLHYITNKQFKQADKEQLQSHLAPLKEGGVTTFRAPYFTQEVVRQLCARYGDGAVYEDGLQVYTTLDMRAQRAAEEALTRGVERLRAEGGLRRGLMGQGALACVDVHTGDIIAMVGGVGPWEKVQFNRASPGPPLYGRQPGSSFKPYVWATALENGYGPSSCVSADPISIPIGNGNYYSPKNYTPRQHGIYTLRNALAQSVNLVSVRLVRKLGIEEVRRNACLMLNIPEQRIQPYYSLALGANNLSPLEQATGYCVFASGGLRPTANYIRRITDYRGTEIYTAHPEVLRVLPSDVALSMISMLRSVVTSGTGRRANISGYTVCGKTGTTNSARDAWWVGFSPDLCAAVWVGNDDYAPMPRASGSGFCVPIWARFMKKALDAMDLHGRYPKGAGVTASRSSDHSNSSNNTSNNDQTWRTVTICTATGLLANPYCPNTVQKTFAPGQPLPGRCTMHGPPHNASETVTSAVTGKTKGQASHQKSEAMVTVCVKSGLRAGPYCAQTIEVPASQAPKGYCNLCGPKHHAAVSKSGGAAETAKQTKKTKASKPGTPKKSPEGKQPANTTPPVDGQPH